MRITRRRVLLGASALTAAALSGRFVAPQHVVAVRAPDEAVDRTMNVLVLHDGGPAGHAFAGQVRGSTRRAVVTDRAVAVLTLEGFKQAGALIESVGGATVIALLNDAETVVIDSLLKARCVAGLDRCRYGRQILLTARL